MKHLLPILCLSSLYAQFTIGYNVKQDISVSDVTEDIDNRAFNIGYWSIGNSGKNKKIDFGIEYISKFSDDFDVIEVSMYNWVWNWRILSFDEKTDFFIRFGVSYLLSLKVLDVELDVDSFWWEDTIDGGFNYGIGILHNKQFMCSFVSYDLNASSDIISFFSWEDDYYNIDFETSAINFSYLFK